MLMSSRIHANIPQVSTFFSCMFQCSPVNYYWDQPRMDVIRNGEVIQPGGTCFDQLAFYLSQSSLAVFTDAYVCLITKASLGCTNIFSHALVG